MPHPPLPLVVTLTFLLVWQLTSAPDVAGHMRGVTRLDRLATLSAEFEAMLREWKIPGAQLAVAYRGRLVLDAAYGVADRETGDRTTPRHLFRIGSVSKTLTTVAILQLIERGHLRLADRVFPALRRLTAADQASADPRLDEITVQHLLQHQGGWARFDALELPHSNRAADALSIPSPPDCASIIRYMRRVPLDFRPGTAVAYSNFGFCVLGRLIEQTISRHQRTATYEEYVKAEILAPAAITTMRIGGTRLSERAPDEVRYHPSSEAAPEPSVYPGDAAGPYAYGGFYLRASAASGGWIASARDLVRFGLAIDGTRGPALLGPRMRRLMLETPLRLPDERPGARRTGLGWTVVGRPTGFDYWHLGGLRSSNAAGLVRTSRNVTLAFTMNTLPVDHAAFFGDVLPRLLDLSGEIDEWPRHDLFNDVGRVDQDER